MKRKNSYKTYYFHFLGLCTLITSREHIIWPPCFYYLMRPCSLNYTLPENCAVTIHSPSHHAVYYIQVSQNSLNLNSFYTHIKCLPDTFLYLTICPIMIKLKILKHILGQKCIFRIKETIVLF